MLAVTLTMAPLNGCRRWIRFGGFTLQSSEVAKFEMILLCSSLAAKAPQVEKLSPGKMVIMNFREWLHVRVWKQLVIPVLPLIPVIALLALEPHMSGIVLTVAVVGTILLLSGSGGILTGGRRYGGPHARNAAVPCGLHPVSAGPSGRLDPGPEQDDRPDRAEPVRHRFRRADRPGAGQQRGKQPGCPRAPTTSSSAWCEELALWARCSSSCCLCCSSQGLWIAYRAENLYCTMVGIGIMAQIAWQVFCNIAVVTNTLPNTGISLPFFSSGGTSLILLLAEMGVMVNIGRNGERAAQQRCAPSTRPQRPSRRLPAEKRPSFWPTHGRPGQNSNDKQEESPCVF